MKSLRCLVLALLITGILGVTAAADPTAVVGAWRVDGTDEGGRPRSAVLFIEEAGGQLTGRWNTRTGSVELRDVRYEDGKLSCWWYVDIEKTLIKLFFSADVDGDSFKGTLKEPHVVGNITGSRIKVKSPEANSPTPDGSR